MGMKARLNRLGFHKRSCTQAAELVYCLMIWVWLKVDSIGMFARESLRTFSRAERDALYAVLNHEDRNWRSARPSGRARIENPIYEKPPT